MATTETEQIIHDSLTRDDINVVADERKLAELILLVAQELEDDPYGGATKVNKVLYFAEFAVMRQTGRPITGCRYQRLPNGPAPRRLRPIRDELIAAGEAELVLEYVPGYTQHRLRSLRPARRELFTAEELKGVAEAVALLKGRTAAEVSDLSHREPGWRMVGNQADIPFVTAFLPQDQPEPSPRARARMREIGERLRGEGRLAT